MLLSQNLSSHDRFYGPFKNNLITTESQVRYHWNRAATAPLSSAGVTQSPPPPLAVEKLLSRALVSLQNLWDTASIN